MVVSKPAARHPVRPSAGPGTPARADDPGRHVFRKGPADPAELRSHHLHLTVVLFLEHLPDRLARWLSDPIGRAAAVERQLFEVVAFLRAREILHLDGHFGNIRADDDRLYLVDFGLATSPRFDLSDAERDFAARNAGHDADYASMRLVNWLVTSVCGVPVPTGGVPVARNQFVQRRATGDLPPEVPPPVARIIARHAPAAARMNAFCCRLFDGDLDAAYPGSPGPVPSLVGPAASG